MGLGVDGLRPRRPRAGTPRQQQGPRGHAPPPTGPWARDGEDAPAGDGNRLGITLNLHPGYPSRNTDADREAARRADGQANRLYLDPLFRREYPAAIFSYYGEKGADLCFVRDGDLQKISIHNYFLGINYYFRNTVRE